MKKVFELTQHGEGIGREQMDELKKLMDPETIRQIQNETLEFIKVNMNHLPMYYIPGDEFPYGALN